MKSSPMDYADWRRNDHPTGERLKVDAPALTVAVNNATKSYRSFNGKRHLVFEGVNLTLPPRTVYGLLGPSGCGKTSLIRCILGRLDLDEGSISVFGHCPGTVASGVPGPNVGYMPQETSIPETLTIGQCWTYYGTVLGLSKEEINQAIDYFIQLLNLPPANTVNSQLSGGELRRVAFATALIHKPKLLILDEPTTGIDCITKKNMWDHLLKLANENTSIILTTHYIEEARAAHKVGLMHDNALAVEDYTENVLQKFGCDSLESAFLKICCNSNQSMDFVKEVEAESMDVWIPMKKLEPVRVESDVLPEHKSRKVKSGCRRLLSREDFRVRTFVLKAVVLKNWLHLYRFPGVLLILTLLPCIQVSCSIFSFKEVVGQKQFALVNDDIGLLGNQYLSYLNADILRLQSFDTDFGAFEALRSGRVRGIIVIRQNFSDALLDRIVNAPLVKTDMFNDSVISVTLDPGDAQIKFVRLHLLSAYELFLYATYNETGGNYLLARPVIYFERAVVEYISTPRNLRQCIHVMTATLFFAPFAACIVILFVDIYYGHLERSVVAGVTLAEILLGLLLVLLVCGGVQLAFILLASFVLALRAFSWGSLFLVFLVLYAHGLCGTATGMLLSVVCSDINLLAILTGNLIILTGATAGGFWPLVSMPYFFRGIYLALPQAYQVRAVFAIYLGTSYFAAEMLCSLVLSIAYTVVFLTLTMIILKIKT